MSGKTDIRILIGIVFVAFFAISALYLPAGPVNATPDPEPKPRPKKTKYSAFPHNEKAHRLECGTCHKFPSANWNKVRTGPEAFPDQTDYPKHDSCVKCHKQQFFKGARPAICSICHTNPSPRDSSRHPFPNPREIFDLSPKGKTAEGDFVVEFPHDKHIEIVSMHRRGSGAFVNASFLRDNSRRMAEESCSVCHQTMNPQDKSDDEFQTKPPATIGDAFWLKKGTFKTAPIGHTNCFTCHSADTGILPTPQTCSGCHQLKPPKLAADFDSKLAATMIIGNKVMTDAWRRRESAGAYRHEFFAHAELSCATCHNVMTLKTAEPLTQKVNISSCATCHATPTPDDGGALNYEMDKRKENPSFQCVKCHITFGKLPVPESHARALASAAVVKPAAK
ncbi:MAG: cytochrome c3 family protein [Pyrinomonadaceae bacterium]